MHVQKRVPALIATTLALTVAGCGITGNFRGHPGYASFTSPGLDETSRQFALSLGPLPLTLARAVTRGDPDISAMLKGVRALRVYTYEINGDQETINERLEATWTRLSQGGWHPVFTVRSEGELTSGLIRMRGDHEIVGVAFIDQDDQEITFVNVIGSLRPEMLSAFMTSLGIDGFEADIEN